MANTASVEIFIIGNEILNGEIQDTNTHWLCREITRLGGQVVRGTVLGDDLEVIAGALQAALARGTRVIFTAGGLGPTADDLTLAAVAKGIGVPLKLHDQAREMIRRSYDDLHERGILDVGGLTPAREKMAWLPEGARTLVNPVGTAPGVLVPVGSTAVISLPGVPPELKGIFSSSLQPFLRETFEGGLCSLHTLTVHCNDESLLEPVLSRIVPAHPGVYIKSLATRPGEMAELDIVLTATGDARDTVQSLVEAALGDLKKGLDSLGFTYLDKPSEPSATK
jgi:molybdenum cofactor synthesis domain-containing protein